MALEVPRHNPYKSASAGRADRNTAPIAKHTYQERHPEPSHAEKLLGARAKGLSVQRLRSLYNRQIYVPSRQDLVEERRRSERKLRKELEKKHEKIYREYEVPQLGRRVADLDEDEPNMRLERRLERAEDKASDEYTRLEENKERDLRHKMWLAKKALHDNRRRDINTFRLEQIKENQDRNPLANTILPGRPTTDGLAGKG